MNVHEPGAYIELPDNSPPTPKLIKVEYREGLGRGNAFVITGGKFGELGKTVYVNTIGGDLSTTPDQVKEKAKEIEQFLAQTLNRDAQVAQHIRSDRFQNAVIRAERSDESEELTRINTTVISKRRIWGTSKDEFVWEHNSVKTAANTSKFSVRTLLQSGRDLFKPKKSADSARAPLLGNEREMAANPDRPKALRISIDGQPDEDEHPEMGWAQDRPVMPKEVEELLLASGGPMQALPDFMPDEAQEIPDAAKQAFKHYILNIDDTPISQHEKDKRIVQLCINQNLQGRSALIDQAMDDSDLEEIITRAMNNSAVWRQRLQENPITEQEWNRFHDHYQDALNKAIKDGNMEELQAISPNLDVVPRDNAARTQIDRMVASQSRFMHSVKRLGKSASSALGAMGSRVTRGVKKWFAEKRTGEFADRRSMSHPVAERRLRDLTPLDESSKKEYMHMQLASLGFHKGKYSGVEVDAEGYVDQMQYAQEAFDRGEYALAENLWYQMSSKDTLGEAHYQLGNLYKLAGKDQLAIHWFIQGSERENIHAKLEAAKLLILHEKTKDAVTYLRELEDTILRKEAQDRLKEMGETVVERDEKAEAEDKAKRAEAAAAAREAAIHDVLSLAQFIAYIDQLTGPTYTDEWKTRIKEKAKAVDAAKVALAGSQRVNKRQEQVALNSAIVELTSDISLLGMQQVEYYARPYEAFLDLRIALEDKAKLEKDIQNIEQAAPPDNIEPSDHQRAIDNLKGKLRDIEREIDKQNLKQLEIDKIVYGKQLQAKQQVPVPEESDPKKLHEGQIKQLQERLGKIEADIKKLQEKLKQLAL